ncbi:MAG TPA: FAD-binding oxidoreductase, partial [Rhodocyclaceae bacterium]
MSDLINALRNAIGADRILTDAVDVAPYLRDWRGRYEGDALCVARPGSTQQVAAIVRLCAEAGVAIVPQGGNTGLCGGATPRGAANQPNGEVVVSLARLDRVRAIDAANNTITVEAGCTLLQVQ